MIECEFNSASRLHFGGFKSAGFFKSEAVEFMVCSRNNWLSRMLAYDLRRRIVTAALGARDVVDIWSASV